MDYKELTVFNYKVAYYVMRIFGLYWVVQQYFNFSHISGRPASLYEPHFYIQKLIFPHYPSATAFVTLLIILALLFLWTLFKQSALINVFIFLLMAVINLPVAFNYSGLHFNHLILLGFFLSIFLLPKNLKSKNDYKWVQYFYLGLLCTYSIAGFSKFLGIAKNLINHSGKLLWIDLNAAKVNTYVNYWIDDMMPPQWMQDLYQYPYLWVILTMGAIAVQASCFLGAFSRKYLTFIMLFLFSFHLYTALFVIADFKDAKYFILVAFFPYHLLPFLKNSLASRLKVYS